jgi:hypothetical protein
MMARETTKTRTITTKLDPELVAEIDRIVAEEAAIVARLGIAAVPTRAGVVRKLLAKALEWEEGT